MSQKSISGGLLIVFEGIDGVGKSTQLNLVKNTLETEDWQTEVKRNLGGTPIGEELRKVMLSTISRPASTNLYISVAIQEALIQNVAEARQNNGIILMDRGPLSLAAYEIFGGKLDESLGWQHVDNGMNKLSPDLTIIYTANVTVSLERARKASKSVDYFESKPDDYFEDVANGYVQASKRYGHAIVFINADESIDKVHELTMDAIRLKLA